jgi:hypothetical protein
VVRVGGEHCLFAGVCALSTSLTILTGAFFILQIMITETKTIYKCEHCRKLYQVKAAAERHENKCKRRPDYQRACFGCAFITKKDVEFENKRL